MRLYKRHLSALLVLAFLMAIGVMIAQKQGSSKGNAVEDFKVEDIPHDDGTGLMLSWKPLHRSQRIIEYRIYRGISPDTLFFLASVQVNVKTGVASDRMYYYDSGGSDFIDISSPGKLRKEKQQDAKSPLYRAVPRDMEIAARLSEKFDLLSYVDRRQFYYHHTAATSADSTDSTTYAGFNFKQQSIIAGLKENETYYYSVVAVNERNQFQQYAKPLAGTPVGNPPEAASAFYCVYLKDEKELRFEWDYPLFKDDIQQYQIYTVSGAVSDTMWAKLRALPDTLGTYRQPIWDGGVGGGVLKNYAVVPVPDYSEEQIRQMKFAIELIDPQGGTLGNLVSPVVATKAMLPDKPSFRVEDKPNDKGDRLTVIWDKPIAIVAKTTSIDAANTKLKVNYLLNKTDTQKVKNIYFSFYRMGEDAPFATINEFYQDMSVKVNIPKGYDYRKGLKVKITMAGEGIDPKTYWLEQELTWDTNMMALMPSGKLWRNGKEISDIQIVTYRMGIRGKEYTLVKRSTSLDNSLDIAIGYPTQFPKPILGINFVKGDTLHTYAGGKRYSRPIRKGDPRKGLCLMPTEVDFTFDKENKVPINVSIYAGEAAKALKAMQDDIASTQANTANLGTPADPEGMMMMQQMQGKLENLENRLKAFQTNPHMKKLATIKGQDARVRYIASVREPESRHQTYQLVRTNGKGLFSVSDPDTLANGEANFMMPVSNWFAKDRTATLVAVILYAVLVAVFVFFTKRGRVFYVRPIAGLEEIDNAVGRATEMGRPMMYMMGSGGLSEVNTLASMGILSQVAKKAAEYDTKLIVPCYNFIVMPVVQEIVRDAHYSVGRPDTYDKNNVFFLSDQQFPYVAAVNGIMIRERVATNFYMGGFAAEALLMTETGNIVGAVQVAGSDAITQIPFFITTCDFTLIGEELYAASAYLNPEPMLMGALKSQDIFKLLITILVTVSALLASFQVMTLLNIFPTK